MGDTHEKKGPAAILSPWSRTPEDLFGLLATTPEGLEDEEAERRLREWGPNELKRNNDWRMLHILLDQFASPLIFMLVLAAVVAMILKDWAEAGVILLAVLVNAALGFYQERKAENTVEQLSSYIKESTRVIRKSETRSVDPSTLVPGDVIHLAFGARVPADVRLIAADDFSTDESVITGESLPIRKSVGEVPEGAGVTERTNMAFAGSLVVEGYATALVVGTAGQTEIGRIALLVSEASQQLTPLQESLKKLAWVIFGGILVVIAGLFFLGLSRGEPFLEMLLLSAAVAVGAIPEALPIALTVILAAGAERVARGRGIMRSLGAAETLGSTTLVMTDKTGTLTQAKMQVTGILTKAELLSGEPHAQADMAALSHVQKNLLASALLSTDAVIENPDDFSMSWQFIGRPLEVNIALAAQSAGLDILALTRDRRKQLLPFNSTNKFSVTLDTHEHVYSVLGAPDILLQRSKLSKDEYIALEKQIEVMSEAGGRLLGVARHPMSHAQGAAKADLSGLSHMEFLGVILLYDPIRPDAADAVQRIESHGASVVMVTGDLRGTALSVARSVGWNVEEANIMTGQELREFSDDELRDRLPLIRIFARVTPEDKLRIGRLFRERGEVVAMTGDGVNDAPALKAADIGIALGSGSDVAKSAADLVLLDDSFNTIVLAIEEGRRIISNIRKAFVYLMSNSLDEVILIGGSLIVGLPLPLSAIQIIWVNFFTGSLPALAYAFEENRDVGFKHGGRGSIFNTEVQVLTLGVGIASSVLLFVLYWVLADLPLIAGTAQTTLFLCFASYILVVAFSFKSLHRPLFTYPLFDNKTLNTSLLIAGVVLVCSALVPALRELLGLTTVSGFTVIVVLLWLALNVALVEGAKWVFRHTRARKAPARM